MERARLARLAEQREEERLQRRWTPERVQAAAGRRFQEPPQEPTADEVLAAFTAGVLHEQISGVDPELHRAIHLINAESDDHDAVCPYCPERRSPAPTGRR